MASEFLRAASRRADWENIHFSHGDGAAIFPFVLEQSGIRFARVSSHKGARGRWRQATGARGGRSRVFRNRYISMRVCEEVVTGVATSKKTSNAASAVANASSVHVIRFKTLFTPPLNAYSYFSGTMRNTL